MREKLYSQRILDCWVDKPTKTLFGSGYAGLGVEKVARAEVQEFMKRISFSSPLEMPRYPVRIKVNLKNGRSCVRTYWPPRSSPENPASDEELIAKYRNCAEWCGLTKEKTEKSIKLIMGLEKLKDINGLMKLMRGRNAQ